MVGRQLLALQWYGYLLPADHGLVKAALEISGIGLEESRVLGRDRNERP